MDSLAPDCGWVPIERTKANIRASKDSSPVIKRSQFLLMPAWGCTVHKVQGLTMEKVVVSFDLVKQQSFNYGQMYVALRRATSLDNLFLIGSLILSTVKADSRAIHERQRL